MLDVERQYFQENRQAWADSYPDQFVLVKDRKLIGCYSSAEDAITEGAHLFGLSSFLVRNVNEEARNVCVPALTLGILNANFDDHVQRERD